MFNLGDKVKLSDFYLSNYCGVDSLKDKVAEITNIGIRYIKLEDLMQTKDAFQKFFTRYGKLDRYEVCTLQIKYPNINAKYIVSQFGIELVK